MVTGMKEDNRYCSQCGGVLSPSAKFCRQCGSEEEPQESKEGSAQAIEWDLAFPLLTNRFFLYDMAKLLFWTFVLFDGLVLTLLAFEGDIDSAGAFLAMSGLILLGFMIMIALIAAVFFGNSYPTRYRVDPKGAFYQSLSRRARNMNRVGLLIGLIRYKPGVAGAALLATTREGGGDEWDDIHTVKEYPAQRVITLMDSWHVVQRLYCTPENYDTVAGLVRTYAAAGAAARQQARLASSSRPSTVPHRAKLSLIVLLAFAAVLICPVDVSAAVLSGIFLLALVTIWIPGLSRFTGALVLGGAAVVGLVAVRAGIEVHSLIPAAVLKGEPVPQWAQFTKFGGLKGEELFRMGAAALGLLAFACLGLSALAGRLHRNESTGNP
jgi:hypothetical protein